MDAPLCPTAPPESPPDCALREEWLVPGKVFTHPDWRAVGSWVSTRDPAHYDATWCALARSWLLRLADDFAAGHRVYESRNLIVLFPGAEDRARRFVRFAEEVFERLRRTLGELAVCEGYGKFAVIVAPDLDAFLHYISDFHRDGEHPLPGGVYLNRGYGHIAFPSVESASAEASLVHEFSHALINHHGIPLWLDEGIAQLAEHMLGAARIRDPMLREDPALHWTPENIGRFWSGRSYDTGDDTTSRSYELSLALASAYAAISRPKLAEAIKVASIDDAGFAAFEAAFGITPAEMLERMLGPGDWSNGHLCSVTGAPTRPHDSGRNSFEVRVRFAPVRAPRPGGRSGI